MTGQLCKSFLMMKKITPLFDGEFKNIVCKINPEPETHIDIVHTFLISMHHLQSQIHLLRKERVSSATAAILLRIEGTREQKYTEANGEGPTPQDHHIQQAEAMSKMTISIMDNHIGGINWSLWSEKTFDQKRRLKWKLSFEDLRT